MSRPVIKVEEVSKMYRLGEVGTGTLSHDFKRWAYRMRGKEDPFLRIGEKNDRTQAGNSDYVWSLRDISFSVYNGDVLGIIGRNGAGKSTLLKILSRTTSPTHGSIKIRGRVASLLEVGTGFHPELSGRDNIFLNGAILGMTKNEIKRKFDEIVDFAGVERYIDTPVKRYSSGMYVRLAFAVAAHLEPEILIVDEVLAVGDAEFQKKCLGKMKDVSTNEGRTVLFVSHNMGAIAGLCNKCVLLEEGQLKSLGDTDDIIYQYITPRFDKSRIKLSDRTDRTGTGKVIMTEVELKDKDGKITDRIFLGEPFSVRIKYQGELKSGYVAIVLNGHLIENIVQANSFYSLDKTAELQSGVVECFFDENILMAGEYHMSLHVGEYDTAVDSIENALTFQVDNKDVFSTGRPPEKCGLVYAPHHWKFE